MAKVFAIVMNKGGSGKSSLAVNLGSQLSLKRYRVLIIDMDEQRNVLLSFRQNKNTEKSIREFLLGKATLEEVAINVSTGLDVINGPNAGFSLEVGVRKSTKKDPIFTLKNRLDNIRSRYDYIIIDTPPHFGFETTLGMVASDQLIIPFIPDYYGSSALVDSLNEIEGLQKTYHPELKINCVVPFKVVKISKNHKKTINECIEFLEMKKINIAKTRVWNTTDSINSLYDEYRPPALSRKTNKLKYVYKKLMTEVLQNE